MREGALGEVVATMTADPTALHIEHVLETDADPEAGRPIGRSREGRPIVAYRFGDGARSVSLIGGCHADEPVGPAMLGKLCAYLAGAPRDSRLVRDYSWYVVPDVNPDGAHRNARWTGATVECRDHSGAADYGYELPTYVESVVRELPGDDIEFGFPRGSDDGDARPENLAVAHFLAAGAPFTLHASFHGMDFAVGPWFLIERSWRDRTIELRDRLRRRVRTLGYRLFDLDRGGEKGFHRIDEGFTTRPDSEAMIAHFRALGDERTASLFRPSSMEFVRGLGGDPFTLVSEMPLFLLQPANELPETPTGPESRRLFHAWVLELADRMGREDAHAEAGRLGLAPMPIRDQMRLQLAFLGEGLAATRRRLPARDEPVGPGSEPT